MTDTKKETPKLLYFADYSDPILHEPIEPVLFPLSKEDKQLIEDMKYSIQAEQLKKAGAAWNNAAGMAANQWGQKKRIFLYCPEGKSHKNLEVIINPSYEPIQEPNSGETSYWDEWESCFSVPLATGNLRRYTHIRATYQNELGETIVRELSGYFARVWQHENDHLDGFLYDDHRTGKCLEKHTFSSRLEVEEFFNSL